MGVKDKGGLNAMRAVRVTMPNWLDSFVPLLSYSGLTWIPVIPATRLPRPLAK